MPLRHALAAALAAAIAAGAAPALAHGGHHRLVGKSAPATGGDFALQSARGPVSLASLRGKVVAIYFGYLNCSDLCPTALAALAEALRRLPPESAAEVEALFVTLDPERDTAATLADYAAGFHPRLVGLTGERNDVEAAAKAFGVLFRRVKTAGGYDIDHSSLLIVIGRAGRLRERLPHTAGPARIARALARALADTGPLR